MGLEFSERRRKHTPLKCPLGEHLEPRHPKEFVCREKDMSSRISLSVIGIARRVWVSRQVRDLVQIAFSSLKKNDAIRLSVNWLRDVDVRLAVEGCVSLRKQCRDG